MKNLLYLLLGFVAVASITLFSCWNDKDNDAPSVVKDRLATYQAYEEALK